MSEILFLCHRPPWPPTRGDSIRSWAMLCGLAERARVHLLCFGDPDDQALGRALREVATSVTVVPRPRLPVGALASAALKGRPLSVAAFTRPTMRRLVGSRLTQGVDRTYIFSGQMAQYAPAGAVLDLVDVDSAKFGHYAAASPNPLRRVFWTWEERALARFERRAAERAADVLFVSDAEAELWHARGGGGHVQVLPNGVDLAHFDPAVDRPRPGGLPQAPTVLFTGQMDYPPNVEAVRRFASQVMPRLADTAATFVIAGRAPTAAVRALAGEGVVVTGEVVDMRDWLTHATVAVAPLVTARGVQNKVLEALAMARPMVVSGPALDGLSLRPGRDLLLADRPGEQADAVRRLLDDPVEARALGLRGREAVEWNHGWPAVLRALDTIVWGAHAGAS